MVFSGRLGYYRYWGLDTRVPRRRWRWIIVVVYHNTHTHHWSCMWGGRAYPASTDNP